MIVEVSSHTPFSQDNRKVFNSPTADRVFVQDRATAAFGLAANAAAELRKNLINPNIEHVFELLFGRKPGDRIAALQLVESK
jgi:hypothetical protein